MRIEALARFAIACAGVWFAAAACAAPPDGDWPDYGRTPGGDRHSPLAQIDRTDVARLEAAWEFRTGEADASTGNPIALEATPLMVDGRLFLSTPLGRVIAAIRSHVAPHRGDRSYAAEIEALAMAITAGELRRAAGIEHELG
jgi:glucose dehydrogenase